MLYFAPRNKTSVTFYAWMVELVDTTDLKSVDPKGRAGSSPAPGTKREIAAMRSPVFDSAYFNCQGATLHESLCRDFLSRHESNTHRIFLH